MLRQPLTRMFHTTRLMYAGAEKSALAALRKKTGYTFANCKKALELNSNNFEMAEKWLHEQAQSLGWSKATKLADRATAQGLIGVLIRGNVGAMIEVNCETDFVARNENFRGFVNQVARQCAYYTQLTEIEGDLWKLGFEVEALKHLNCPDGKTLGDHLALLIGSVGENAVIKRATCFKSNSDTKLYGYAHPAPTTSDCVEDTLQFGKYGALVAFRGPSLNEELMKNLCQHIVGLNPKKIGEEDIDQPVANKDDETCLIHQEYLLEPDRSVGEVLKENDLTIVDYQRFECGEVFTKATLREAHQSG